MLTTATTDHLRVALRNIAAQTYSCDICGVEYIKGYEGRCSEPAPNATFNPDTGWSRKCHGTVNARGTAQRALDRSST